MSLLKHFDRHLNASDSSYQMALDGITAQHQKPSVNRWMPPKLAEDVPLMPAECFVKRLGGNFTPACWVSRGLHRIFNHRCSVMGQEASFDLAELQLIRELGYKITIEGGQ